MHNRSRARHAPTLIALSAISWLVCRSQRADAEEPVASTAPKTVAHVPSAKLDLLPDIGVRPRADFRVEWTVASFDVDHRHFVGATGIGLAGSWVPQRPYGMRIFETGVSIFVGDFGDERHGLLHFQFAYKPRFTIPTSVSIIQPYVGPRLAFVVSPVRNSGGAGYSAVFGQTAGVSIAGGLIDAEVTANTIFAINDEFRPFGQAHGDKWKPGLDLTLATDICFFGGWKACRYPAPQSIQVNLTEKVNGYLASVAKTHPADHAQLCKAADTAVSLISSVTEGSGSADSFFCRMEAKTAQLDIHKDILRAHYMHQALEACYAQFDTDAREAKRQGQSLRQAEQYLPDPSELRRALACEDHADPYFIDPSQMALACRACPAACEPMPSTFQPQCTQGN